MATTLYRGGRVHTPAHPQATAMLVDSAAVVWLGPDADAPAADQVIELDGALVTPAFVDAHVHATDTGITLSGLDLAQIRSAGGLLDAVAGFAAGLAPDAVLLGHGWDESTWGTEQQPPSAAELERAGGGRLVYLSQASIHSALCSAGMLAAASPSVQGAAGYDPGGWQREAAHHVVREIAMGSVRAPQRRLAQQAALARAASRGIAAVHECGGPGTSDEADFAGVLALGGAANGRPEVYGYWGELMAVEKAVELRAIGAGGDLYADGALGSQTAHLREPYVDSATGSCGFGYLSTEEVGEHLVECTRHGVQGGFHAIGDQALTTVLAGFQAAAARVGVDGLRSARHRIEHVELADRAIVAGLVEYGVVASVQPAFDRLWGGEHQMYAQRLGTTRSLESNPVGAMHAVGVALAFGSDSPVTPMDPWGSVRAAMAHFNPAYRMSDRAAFAAHTRGGWRAARFDGEGALVPQAPATFAVWSTPDGLARSGLPVLEPASPLPRCRRTVLRGRTIYDEEATPS